MAARTTQRQESASGPKPGAETVLPCPDCECSNNIESAALFEGSEIRCIGCGAGLIVARDRIEHDGVNCWILISTLIDFDEP